MLTIQPSLYVYARKEPGLPQPNLILFLFGAFKLFLDDHWACVRVINWTPC
jgi:hypothetical protein